MTIVDSRVALGEAAVAVYEVGRADDGGSDFIQVTPETWRDLMLAFERSDADYVAERALELFDQLANNQEEPSDDDH